MKYISLGLALPTLLTLLASASLSHAQTVYLGVEPNENKFQATPAPNMVAGDSIETDDCGSFTTNVFRVGTAPAPPAIYQHRLRSSLSTFGYFDVEIQGRDGINDLALPQSVEILARSFDVDPTLSEPFVGWYGFGKSEELFADLTGGFACRATGIAELATTEITPTVLAPIPAALSPVTRVNMWTTGTVDTEIQIFDSEFNALYANGIDDTAPGSTQASFSLQLIPGRYFVAVSDHEVATHLPPSTLLGEFKNPAALMDFRGGIMNGSAAFPRTFEFNVQDNASGSVESLMLTKTEPFQILWFQLDVGSGQASASFCAGDGTLAPCPACSSDAPLGAGTGCRNSTGRGANLTFFIAPNFSGNIARLNLEGLPAGAASLVFIAPATASPVPIGGGLFCIGSGAFRQPVVAARLDGMAVQAVDTTVFPASMFGQTVYAQGLYRDVGSPCGLNVSSGISFVLF